MVTAVADEQRTVYGLQFHPEVDLTSERDCHSKEFSHLAGILVSWCGWYSCHEGRQLMKVLMTTDLRQEGIIGLSSGLRSKCIGISTTGI